MNQRSDKNQSIALFLAAVVTDAWIDAWVAVV